jgi:BlaI family transcriptional regulator, penicillinase repressor
MALPKLTRLELAIMEIVWTKGACSIREIQESFPEKGRPAFTTIQTTVYRLERKRAVRCAKRIGKANIFEAAISRNDAEKRLIDELLDMLAGRGKPVMAHLVEAGEVTLEDVKEAEQALRKLTRKEGKK